MKIWQKTIVFVATFALLLNSLSAPLIVLAEETTPSPSPEATTQPTDSPTPTDVPTTTPEATVEATATPEATPDATPTEIATPTPEATPAATDLVTPTPSDQPAVTQAPESNPTTQGPPASTEPSAEPSVTPTATPVFVATEPEKEGTVTTQVVTTNVFPSTVQNDLFKLITDKLDYAPTEAAIITGSDFSANKTYNLTISSTDDPATSVTVDVTTDGNGNFSYTYQLDGNYRPNYKVEVKDGEQVVAVTTFTDTPCHGNCPPPPQADLTATKTNSVGGSVTLGNTFVWKIRVANIGNANAQFSKDNIILQDNMANVGVAAYGAPVVTFSAGVTGGVSNIVCSQTGTYNEDLSCVVIHTGSHTITIPANEYIDFSVTVTPTTETTLYNPRSASDVCKTNPDGAVTESNTGNNACSDSVKVNPAPPTTGTLIVQKTTIPGGDPTVFSINTTSSTGGTITGGGAGTVTDTTDKNYEVTAGTYSVSETVPAGWSKTGDTCQDVVIAPGETKTCLITNTKQSTLTINKVLNPVGSGAFDLKIDGVAKAFNVGDGGTTGPQVVTVGSHTFSEGAGNPHTNTSDYFVTYGGDSGCNSDGTVTVSAGESKTCTITNTAYGSVSITKDVVPDNSSVWNFQLTGTGGPYTANGLGDNQSHLFGHLVPGNYELTETADTNYATNVVCNGTTVSPDSNGYLIGVGAGQAVRCTITNTQLGSISGYKYEDQNGTIDNPNTDINSVSGWAVNLWSQGTLVANTTTDTSGQYSFTHLLPGTYQVVEGSQTNWVNLTPATIGVTLGAGVNSTDNNFLNTYIDTTQSGRVTLCHATGSSSNPFVQITVSSSGAYHGHYNNHAGDIIPHFIYNGNILYSKNWDGNALNQAIWNNGCNPNFYGTITVHKVFDSHYDWPGTYTNSCFTLNPNPAGFGQVCANSDGYATFSNVPVGTYSVDETKTDTDYSQESNDCTGLALVNNGDSKNCTVTNKHDTGDLVVKKVVDDKSDLTQWSFSLDGGAAVHANASGAVDFGQVITNDTHYVVESGPTGYHFVSFTGTNCAVQPNGGYSAIVIKGVTTTCTFTNARNTGTITIVKDAIDNSSQDFTFTTTGTGLPHSFKLDDDGNNNNALSNTRTFTVPTGNYTITENQTSGWKLTDLTCNNENGKPNLEGRKASINVDSNENVTCTFTNTHLAKVWGFKFNDKNANGVWNLLQGEFGLGNWRIFIDQNENQTYDEGEPYQLTSNFFLTKGFYEFDNLMPGNYTLCEEMQGGWTNTTHNLCQNITLTPGDTESFVDFGNTQNGKVTVTKFNDVDQDGKFGEDESALSGWTINLGRSNQITNDKGIATFDNVISGTYDLSENLQGGWAQTNIFCTNEGVYSDGKVTVAPGANIQCYIGNFQTNPKLVIEKTNDRPNGVGQSDTVTYTLTLKNTGNIEVNNVSVQDVPPGGFTYVTGSTVIDGNPASNPLVSGSTLTWNIPSLAVGATTTIVYKLITPNDLSNGTYTNFVTCSGGKMTFREKTIEGVVEGQGVACDPASVTSTVARGQSQSYNGNLNTTSLVLGASTELPGTGSPTVILIIALGVLGAGLFLRGFNAKMAKVKKTVKKAKAVKKAKRKGKKNAKK